LRKRFGKLNIRKALAAARWARRILARRSIDKARFTAVEFGSFSYGPVSHTFD
jgi:hypothetical protein